MAGGPWSTWAASSGESSTPLRRIVSLTRLLRAACSSTLSGTLSSSPGRVKSGSSCKTSAPFPLLPRPLRTTVIGRNIASFCLKCATPVSACRTTSCETPHTFCPSDRPTLSCASASPVQCSRRADDSPDSTGAGLGLSSTSLHVRRLARTADPRPPRSRRHNLEADGREARRLFAARRRHLDAHYHSARFRPYPELASYRLIPSSTTHPQYLCRASPRPPTWSLESPCVPLDDPVTRRFPFAAARRDCAVAVATSSNARARHGRL